MLDYVQRSLGGYAQRDLVNELGRAICITAQVDHPCAGRSVLSVAGPDSASEWFVTNAELRGLYEVLGQALGVPAATPVPFAPRAAGGAL